MYKYTGRNPVRITAPNTNSVLELRTESGSMAEAVQWARIICTQLNGAYLPLSHFPTFPDLKQVLYLAERCEIEGIKPHQI